MTNQNVQTNRHGPQDKGCNKASTDRKHYLVKKLRQHAHRPERRKCRQKHMSGIWEVYLWRVIGKNIRNNSVNCHIVGIGQIMMSPIELLKCCYQFGFLIPQAQQLCSEHFSTLHDLNRRLAHRSHGKFVDSRSGAWWVHTAISYSAYLPFSLQIVCLFVVDFGGPQYTPPKASSSSSVSIHSFDALMVVSLVDGLLLGK